MLTPLVLALLRELFMQNLDRWRPRFKAEPMPWFDVYVNRRESCKDYSGPQVKIADDGTVIATMQVVQVRDGIIWDVIEQEVRIGDLRQPNFWSFISGWIYALTEVRKNPGPNAEFVWPQDFECMKVQKLKRPKWAGQYAEHCLTKGRLGRFAANQKALANETAALSR